MAETKSEIESIIDVTPTFGSYWKAATTVMKIFNGTSPDPLADLARLLAAQIAEIKREVERLHARVNDVNRRQAAAENLARLRWLAEHSDDALALANRIAQNAPDPAERQQIAFEAGRLVQQFLTDPDLWQWTDLQVSTEYDDYGAVVRTVVEALPPDYKTHAALPVYGIVMATWLSAVVHELGGSAELVQRRYGGQLGQHLAMVSVSDGFDGLQHAAWSWPELVKARITCYPVAQTRYAQDGSCTFAIQCDNTMERRRTFVREVVVDGYPTTGTVACTVEPTIARLDELEIEDEQGVAAFATMEAALRQVLATGTLPTPPYVGRFEPTPFHAFVRVYAVDTAGDLHWFRQPPTAVADQLTGWEGPRPVGVGWGDFRALLPAGGNRLYALGQDGRLTWYRHDGFHDGAAAWTGPLDVGHAVPDARAVIGAGDGVLYEIRADGSLHWHHHEDFRDGGTRWTGPVAIGTGWQHFRQVVAAGQGVLYAVAEDGTLSWYRHLGWADGTARWEGPHEVGSGWHAFSRVVPVSDGVLLAIRPDGTMAWYQHEGWLTGRTHELRPAPAHEPNRLGPPPLRQHYLWRGPIEAGADWLAYPLVVGLLPAQPVGPN